MTSVYLPQIEYDPGRHSRNTRTNRVNRVRDKCVVMCAAAQRPKWLAVFIVFFFCACGGDSGNNSPVELATTRWEQPKSNRAVRSTSGVKDVVGTSSLSVVVARKGDYENFLKVCSDALTCPTSAAFRAQVVAAATKGILPFKELRPFVSHISPPEARLLVLDALLRSSLEMTHSQRSSLEFDKMFLLNDLGRASDALEFYEERVPYYEKVAPDAGAKISLVAGDIAWNKEGLESSLRYYTKARELSDPARSSGASHRRFGCATVEMARILIVRGERDKARALIEDALSRIDADVSWAGTLRRIQKEITHKR